ncbi:MAG: glutamine synthetase family protein [Actinomycetota bacterium]|nr:glutamine synthetase family protein [Actinomycetota bacterium]
MNRQQDYVLRSVEERGVRLVWLWFTDVTGQLKSVAISPAELETAFEEGMHFDGSSIEGFSRIQESDVLARPDASTFEVLPWTVGRDTAARVMCDIENVDGTPFAGDSRQVLKRNLDRARELGYSFMVAPEMEFFYFADGDPTTGPRPLDTGSYFDLTTRDVSTNLRRETISMLEQMGIAVEYSFHEDSPSQHEIDLRYTNALEMADNVVTFRLLVKELALERGVHASFMPQPMAGVQGSGMHTHMSLFRDGENVFHSADSSLSGVAEGFIAGLLRHAREITAITNQLVNSYKRLVMGSEAPAFVSWAHNNRSALIRVPVTKPNKTTSTRIEYRAPDPACNPYLAFSVMLAAGMKGIQEGYELPSETSANIWGMSEDEREKAGLSALPATLSEALDEMERSELVAEALGDHIFEWFLRNKRAEYSEYRTQIFPWELQRYFPNW